MNPPGGTASARLHHFYRDEFPFKALARWLSANSPLERREFSYWTNDRMRRYCGGYGRWDEWRLAVVERVPDRIEIGAAFNVPLRNRADAKRKARDPKDWVAPESRKREIMFAERRELVFDIDANDYGDVRACCGNESKVCVRCWPLLQGASQALDHVLRERFGYERVVHVFSGRRGVHCWVGDARACAMNDEARGRILEAVEVALAEEGPVAQILRASIMTAIQRGGVRSKDAKAAEKVVLDRRVTAQRNHLLKSPFCVHPATGIVCVPFDPRECTSPPDRTVRDMGVGEMKALAERFLGV